VNVVWIGEPRSIGTSPQCWVQCDQIETRALCSGCKLPLWAVHIDLVHEQVKMSEVRSPLLLDELIFREDQHRQQWCTRRRCGGKRPLEVQVRSSIPMTSLTR
jgi:hypothetical protein